MGSSSRSRARIACVAAICGLPWSLVIGCASSQGAQPSAAPLRETEGIRGASRSNYITAAELQSVEAMSTLDAVRKLHPEFLRASARTNATTEQATPSVYVNRNYVGDVSWLSMIPIVQIRDIAFLHPTEARVRFGATCPCAAGVVFVQTDSRP
jgi:hypothetical protein